MSRSGSLRRGAREGGHAERKKMIDRNHPLSLTKQAKVLKLSRSSTVGCGEARTASVASFTRINLPFNSTRPIYWINIFSYIGVKTVNMANR